MIFGYFNSIKVRLKLKVADKEVQSLRFQFHKGTIKTRQQYTQERIALISIP